VEQPVSTQVSFKLPVGFQDSTGTLHRDGIMRLATAADEIFPMRDHRVRDNEAYFIVNVLQRVIIKLGELDAISTDVIEGLYLRDFNYLQDLYNEVNGLAPEGRAGGPSPTAAGGQEGNAEALPLRTSFTQR
jgi:hypothetical protein